MPIKNLENLNENLNGFPRMMYNYKNEKCSIFKNLAALKKKIDMIIY